MLFIIDKDKNRISKIEQKTFQELGFKEREHLQEWIAYHPDVFGEELLIIQKEFAGFNDTNERLDLLALDKQGNLVIIENKLDDSGKDVTWQVLKYASYCSSLTKEQIKLIYQEYLNQYHKDESAEEKLKDFFDFEDYEEITLNKGHTQRIILVAANFRKEVTSTVLWLLNYKLRIQCFKVTPFQHENNLLLNIEQVIPVGDTEEYVISMAEKNQDDIDVQVRSKARHSIRFKFWNQLLSSMNIESNLFNNISPSKDNWIGTGTGISATSYNFVVTKEHARVELYFSRSKEENKFIFDALHERKEEIEQKFGGKLIWERLDNKKASRIKFQENKLNVFIEDDWSKMIEFLVPSMIKLESTFKDYLMEIRSGLK